MALDYKIKIKYKRQIPLYEGYGNKKLTILIYNRSTDNTMIDVLRSFSKMLYHKEYDLREVHIDFVENTLELVFLEHDDEVEFVTDLFKYGIINDDDVKYIIDYDGILDFVKDSKHYKNIKEVLDKIKVYQSEYEIEKKDG